MSISAVVLTSGTYERAWPGLDVVVHRSTIRNAADLQRARFDAVAAVRTPHLFFLDQDDGLPDDYLEVLQRCVGAGTALTYTDELISGQRRCAAPYSQAAHLRNPLLVHHLALYRTEAARAAIATLPRGHYSPEVLLAWEAAKRGAAYLPEVGYHWNRSPAGMSAWPCTSISVVRAALWCKAHP